jgi:hypothetical protein
MKCIGKTLALMTALAITGAYFPGYAQTQTSPQTRVQKQTQVENQQRKRIQQRIGDQDGDGICDISGKPVGRSQRNAPAENSKRWGRGNGRNY